MWSSSFRICSLALSICLFFLLALLNNYLAINPVSMFTRSAHLTRDISGHLHGSGITHPSHMIRTRPPVFLEASNVLVPSEAWMHKMGPDPSVHALSSSWFTMCIVGNALLLALYVHWSRDSTASSVGTFDGASSVPWNDGLQEMQHGMFATSGQKQSGRIATQLTMLQRMPWSRWMDSFSASPWIHGSVDTNLLEIKDGPRGRGVFAIKAISNATVVGQYPGVRRSPEDFEAKNDQAEGRAQYYALMCRDGWLLDPTGADGRVVGLPAEVKLGPWSCDATLCLTNEACSDDAERVLGANCQMEEAALGVFNATTTRAIVAGEELLWDYGGAYGDRAHYDEC